MILRVLPGAAGLDPSPDEARRLLERELARSEYPHPSLLDRFLSWVSEQLDGFVGIAADGGVGLVIAVVLAAVVALVLLGALSRVRREPSGAADEAGVLDLPDSADVLRRRAEEALADGRATDALADAARALARRSVERGLIDDSPGRTTHEVFGEVSSRFADHADRLAGAADAFDRVVYGRRGAGPDEAAGVLALEDEVRRARPGAPSGDRGLVVPR